jgi:hypothetical protein
MADHQGSGRAKEFKDIARSERHEGFERVFAAEWVRMFGYTAVHEYHLSQQPI